MPHTYPFMQASLLFNNVQVGGEINKDTFVQLMSKMNEFTVRKTLGIAELVRTRPFHIVCMCAPAGFAA